jgi:hypothetical protein
MKFLFLHDSASPDLAAAQLLFHTHTVVAKYRTVPVSRHSVDKKEQALQIRQ